MQAQQREPSNLARRHTDQARQPVAGSPHRRRNALGLCESHNLTRQRGDGTARTTGERVLRKLQFQAPRRVARGRAVLDALRGPSSDRAMAPALQYRQAALLARLPAAGSRSDLTASIRSHLRSAPADQMQADSGPTLT
jgi:hypothetical protein